MTVIQLLGKALNRARLLEIRHQNADKNVQQHDARKIRCSHCIAQQRRKSEYALPRQEAADNAGDSDGNDRISGNEAQRDGEDSGNQREESHVDSFLHD